MHLLLELRDALLELGDLLEQRLDALLGGDLLLRQQRHLALEAGRVQFVFKEHLSPELDALRLRLREEELVPFVLGSPSSQVAAVRALDRPRRVRACARIDQ